MTRVMRYQALTVLGEYGGHPDGIVHGKAFEPAEQQVVLGLLHELALGAHAVKHLQQHGAQQLLGGDARSAAFNVSLVHAREQRIHLYQGLVDYLAYGPRRMISWNKVFQMPHREQAFGEGVGSAHGVDPLVGDGKTNSLE